MNTKAKPRSFAPMPCPHCTALREDKKKNYSRVYKTKREGSVVIRYIKCGYCDNTFKQVEKVQ